MLWWVKLSGGWNGWREMEEWERVREREEGQQSNAREGRQSLMSTKWTNYDGLHFAGRGQPPSTLPFSLLHSSSLLSSLWQFNFPLSPTCSCLLIVSEALSLGPPLAFGPRYRNVWERRLECQNVIWDSKQPERRRSHTTRADVHLNARACAPPLKWHTHEKTRKRYRWILFLNSSFEFQRQSIL